MSYNLNALLNKESRSGVYANDCRIVFADNYAEAMDLKAYFAAQNPNYASGINENLIPYRKVGPFQVKNKKTILEHLYNTGEVREDLSLLGAEKTASLVREELEKLGIEHYVDRLPKSLSPLQLLRVSFLYDLFDGKDAFLLCDCTPERADDRETRIKCKHVYYEIADYMDKSEKCIFGQHELVWITDLTADEMMELLGNNVSEDDFTYSFFALDGHDVAELDKGKLLSDFAKTPRAAVLAYEKALKYDRYFRTALPQYRGEDDLEQAFDLYKSAAEMGHPGAQFRLGDLYNFGCEACKQDTEKALYWYLMTEYGQNHIDGISENTLYEVHHLAPMRIKALVLEVPSGKEMLRKYAAGDAQRLLKEAEEEKKLEELKKLAGGMDAEDIEHFRKILDKALK